MKNNVYRALRANHHFWLLAGFVSLVFLFGGGARDDIVSLLLLRPLAVVFLAIGLWGLTRDAVRPLRWVYWLIGGCMALTAIHLIPLPPALWTSLPGRGLLVDASAAAGIEPGWRPLTMTPARTWNALFSLIVPLAALVLITRVPVEQRGALVPVLVVIGLVDALLSAAQVVGSPTGPLYFYRVTNNGAAVGLFSNRNHNAAFLLIMFPLLAFLAGQWLTQSKLGSSRRSELTFKDVRPLFLGAFGLALVPLILVAGSRAGILLGVVALLLSPLVLAQRRSRSGGRQSLLSGRRGAITAALVLGLAGVAAYFSRAVALQRLANSGGEEETRLFVWGPVFDMAKSYFPVGSGLGSFIEVFQKDEPIGMLAPSYTNHAHNDVLEVFLTAGAPGVLLMLAAAAYWGWATWQLVTARRRADTVQLTARLGAITVFLLALASVADYPVRVPSLACLLIIGLVWLSDGARADEGKPG